MKKAFILVFLTLLLPFLLASFLSAKEKTETFEKSYPVDRSRPVFLEFYDVDGDLSLGCWEENRVQIRVTKKINLSSERRAERLLRETEVDISHRGNSLKVEIRYPAMEGFFFWLRDYERVRVLTEIMLPSNTSITCAMEDGSVYGEKVKGEMDFRLEDGTIRLNEAEGSLRASTSDGRVILRDFRGEVEAKSEDGDISVSGQITKLTLKTEDGDITVNLAPQSSMAEDWIISTEDGDVEVSLPSSFSADILFETEDGEIECQVPFVFSKQVSERKVSGRINQGGRLFRIVTEDGDVLLRAASSFDHR